MSQVIKLADNVGVEIESETRGFVAGYEGPKVDQQTLDSIQPILEKVKNAVAGVWESASDKIAMDSAEIELGLKVDGEAGWILAKASVGANLKVKMVFKRPPAEKATGNA